MELRRLPGLGEAKIQQLRKAGINTLEELAEVDLRRGLDVRIGAPVLRKAKRSARKLLAAEGVTFEKAKYNNRGLSGRPRKDGSRPRPHKPVSRAHAKPGPRPRAQTAAARPAVPEKKGFFKRLFG